MISYKTLHGWVRNPISAEKFLWAMLHLELLLRPPHDGRWRKNADGNNPHDKSADSFVMFRTSQGDRVYHIPLPPFPAGSLAGKRANTSKTQNPNHLSSRGVQKPRTLKGPPYSVLLWKLRLVLPRKLRGILTIVVLPQKLGGVIINHGGFTPYI